MGVVLRLVANSSKETAAVLRALATEAEAGNLSGVAVCYMRAGGAENVVFTGAYKSASAAASAAMRISWKMTVREREPAFVP
jgi:hypothetical protein